MKDTEARRGVVPALVSVALVSRVHIDLLRISATLCR